jgi:hypothetical protein
MPPGVTLTEEIVMGLMKRRDLFKAATMPLGSIPGSRALIYEHILADCTPAYRGRDPEPLAEAAIAIE